MNSRNILNELFFKGLLLYFLFSLTVFAQQNQSLHFVQLDGIFLNGRALDTTANSELIISTKDSVSFKYHCVSPKDERDAFLFRILIKNNKEASVYTSNNTSVSFKNLPESNYELDIEAFAPQQQWKARNMKIRFLVNNARAEIEYQNIKFAEPRTLIKSDSLGQKVKKTESDFFNDSFKMLIFALAFILFAITVIVIIFKIKNSSIRRKNKLNSNTDSNSSNNDLFTLKTENSNLKAEIAALRSQITSMQSKSKDLYEQNLELKKSIDKVSHNKEELEDLQKQKDDLFAIVIHDIKNPAALIKSLVELLRSYDLNASEQQEVMNDILETSKKIVYLSQEVTRILSLESSIIKLNYDKVDIRDIIKDVHKRNVVAATNKQIESYLDFPDRLPDIYIDVQKIDEVVDNLISNAIKFSHSGGRIRINCKLFEGNIIVEVSDNGLGMTEDDVTKAFARGVKLSAQPTAGESSTGFGLWIVKKLIEAHKGKVWVRSAIGKGSTFAFSLPLEVPENVSETV